MFDVSFFLTVFQEFVRCSNKDIEQIIKKEMSGDVKNAMFAIGKDQPTRQGWRGCGGSGYTLNVK